MLARSELHLSAEKEVAMTARDERIERNIDAAREAFPEFRCRPIVAGVCIDGPGVLIVVGFAPNSVSVVMFEEAMRGGLDALRERARALARVFGF